MQYIREHMGDHELPYDLTYETKGRDGEGGEERTIPKGTKLKDMSPEDIYRASKDLHTASNSQAKAGETVHTGKVRENRPHLFNKPEPQRAKPEGDLKGANVKPEDRIGKAGAPKDVGQVQRAKDAINAALRKAGYRGPEVDVRNFSEVPKELQYLTKSTKALAGYRDANGKMHINAIPHDSIADAMFTAFHELFHRGELGTEAKPYMDALKAAKTNKVVGDLVRAIEAKAAYRGTESISEALAEIGAAKKTGDWARLQAKYGVKMDAFSKASASNALSKFIGKATQFFKKLLGDATGRRMTNEEVHALVDHIYSNQNKKPVGLPDTRASVTPDKAEKLAKLKASREERFGISKEDKLARLKANRENRYDEPTLKQNQEEIKQQAQQIIAHGKRVVTGFGKAGNFILDVRRMQVLSGIMTLGKLANAVVLRPIKSIAEQAVASGLRKFPVLSDISKGAPRYGQGLKWDVEKEVFDKTFSKQTWDQIKQAFKTGDLDIDQFKKYAEALDEDVPDAKLDRPVLDFFTRLHKSIKAVAQLNEFYRSSALRTQFERASFMAKNRRATSAEIAEHMSNEQARIATEAYIDSRRAILMQDNKLYSKLEDLLRAGEQSHDLTAKGASFAAQFLMPVRKIPTNYFIEATENMAGGVKAAGQVWQAIRKGAESLTPEERDYVMRNLSRQTIGAAMMALATYGADKLGGLYVSNKDYKQKDHPKPHEIKVGDTTISGRLLHDPAIEAMQVIATYIHQKEQNKKPADAAINTGKAFIRDIPVIDQFDRLAQAADSEYHRQKFVNDLITSFVVPRGLSDIAQIKDQIEHPDVAQRKTNDLKTSIQASMPVDVPGIGAREQLPAYRD